MGMLIKELKNPLTEEYLSLKQTIFSNEFPWYAGNTTDGLGAFATFFYSHTILLRPTISWPVSRPISDHVVVTTKILKEILNYNDIEINYFIRININDTFNSGGGLACDPHVDHDFPHKNLLIYLNNSSGPTVVIDPRTNQEEYFHPQEDVIITFEGKHCHYQPDIGKRRTVLIATYF
jgi:hypothetical protein